MLPLLICMSQHSAWRAFKPFGAQTSALIAPLEVLLQDSHVCLLCWRYQPGTRWDRWDQNSSCLAGKGDSINRKRRCLRILYRVGARKTSCYLGAGALPWGMIAVGPTEKLSESLSESPKKWVSFKGPIPMHALLIWSRYDVPMLSNCETDRPRPFAVEARNLTPPVPMDQPLRKWRRVPWMISTSSTRFAPSCHTTWWCKWAMPREPRPSLQRWPHLYMTLDFRDLRYWATTSPGKESAVLWFRHETVGIHFLPGLGIVQVTNKRDFMHFSVETTTVGSTAELSISLLHAIRRCNQEMHIMLTRHNCRQHSTTFIGLFQLLSTVQPYVWKWYL